MQNNIINSITINNINKRSKNIRKGLLEFVVLKIIRSEKPSIQEIQKKLLPTDFSVRSDTLYPLLSKLYKEHLVYRDYEQSDHGEARKYYYLTKKGTELLTKLDTYWRHLDKTISQF